MTPLIRTAARYTTAIAVCLLLFSCAGSGHRSEAETEFERGLSSFSKGKYTEAVGHFEKATSLDADFGPAYLYLGRSYVSLGQWGEALQPLRTALRLAPDETRREAVDILIDTLFSAATSELHRGNLKASGRLLNEAMELDPSRSDVPSLHRDTIKD